MVLRGFTLHSTQTSWLMRSTSSIIFFSFGFYCSLRFSSSSFSYFYLNSFSSAINSVSSFWSYSNRGVRPRYILIRSLPLLIELDGFSHFPLYATLFAYRSCTPLAHFRFFPPLCRTFPLMLISGPHSYNCTSWNMLLLARYSFRDPLFVWYVDSSIQFHN